MQYLSLCCLISARVSFGQCTLDDYCRQIERKSLVGRRHISCVNDDADDSL